MMYLAESFIFIPPFNFIEDDMNLDNLSLTSASEQFSNNCSGEPMYCSKTHNQQFKNQYHKDFTNDKKSF